MQRSIMVLLIVGALGLAASFVSHLARPQVALAQAEEISGTLDVNGYTRRFIYAVSPSPAPAAGRPLIILLHGDGGQPRLSAAWKQTALNDANGAVLLAAEGRNNIPPAAVIDGSAWRFRMDEAGQPYDDVDFIDQLIDAATAGADLLGTAIDPDQIYLVGESRGAAFAYFLYADQRTSRAVRAIVPISGTFYCEGGVAQPGVPGTPALPGSDAVCGEVSPFGYWSPRAVLFTAPAAVRAPHIFDVHGQLPPAGGEFYETAPPILDADYQSTSYAGWGDAAGCYTVQVSSQTERTLPEPVGGKVVKSYAFSQAADDLATRCAGLDMTFHIVQGGGHVPGGFEPLAWCFLSSVGGAPSSTACPGAGPSPTPVTPTPITPTPITPTPVTPTPTTPPAELDERVYLPALSD